jgi:nitrogen fixation/metabolism regulation signal transduction histidine kinase
VALLLTAFAFVFGQTLLIVRPLLSLTGGARRLAGGDHDVRLSVEQNTPRP